MMWKSIATAVLLATSAFASPFAATGFCGSNPSQEVVSSIEEVLRATEFPTSSIFKEDAAQGQFTVPVIFHIFYDQSNPSDGNLPDNVILQQMNVINSFFLPVQLSFALQRINRYPISSNVLHSVTPDSGNEAYIKRLRQGDVRTLNIYTVGQGPSGLAGWATFPWDYQSRPQNDGIVMDYNFLPGGKNTDYNTGKITVHEIGHWTGLLHTFQDGCNGGDQVDDTPPEASPASGCPRGRDTCSAPGADPIDNMMDYSDDNCRVRFTNGQYQRLAAVLYQYRGINLY